MTDTDRLVQLQMLATLIVLRHKRMQKNLSEIWAAGSGSNSRPRRHEVALTFGLVETIC
jgi:hypothetical protein